MAAVDILQSDYKLKIDYLTAHLGRMWTRFGWQRRSEPVSATELGVVIAVAFILLWLARFAVWLLRQAT